jgi:hypothetical protein
MAMDYLKFHPGPPCPTLLRPAGRPPPERPYARSILPFWTPKATHLYFFDSPTQFVAVVVVVIVVIIVLVIVVVIVVDIVVVVVVVVVVAVADGDACVELPGAGTGWSRDSA